MMFECKANTDNFIGHKIKLYPTEEQKKILNKSFGFYRWIYNWAIDAIQDNYHNTGNFINYLDICNKFTIIRNDPEYEWLKEFPINSARIALRSAIKAFRFFFSKRNRFPKYKSKRKSKMTFGVRGERVVIRDNGYLSIEGFGPNNHVLYKKSNIPSDVSYPPRIYNVWISFDKDSYWLSFQLEYDRKYYIDSDETDAIGIDVGLRHLATLSNGKTYTSPNTFKLQRRKKRLNRKLSKR